MKLKITDRAKVKFPRSVAIEVARGLCAVLKPAMERLIVAGSLRRRKPEVGDIKILYVARSGMLTPPEEIFARKCNLADEEIARLERD